MEVIETKKKFTICLAFLSLFFLLVSPGEARGQEAGRRLTLAEALDMALEKNNELRAQRNTLYAGREEVGIVRSNLFPRISLEERYSRTVNPGFAFMGRLNQERITATDFDPSALNNPDPIDDFQTTLSLEQPLYIRKVNILLQMAKVEEEAKKKDVQKNEEEIAFRVMQTYQMVGTVSEYVGVAEGALADAKEHQRIAKQRYDSGLGLYSDTLRAATAVVEGEQRLVSAKKALETAQRALGLTIGLAEPVEVTASIPMLPLRELEAYKRESLKRRDIQALELRTEKARKNIDVAKAGFFPSAGLRASYDLNDHRQPLGREGESWQVMAFLNWNIFDGTKRKHEKSKAEYEAEAAAEILEGMKKKVLFAVHEAYAALEEAKKNVELSQQALKTAEEGNRLVEVRYRGSLSPFVDLLDSQVSYDHARANLVARQNEYRFALTRLSYESGAILRDLGEE